MRIGAHQVIVHIVSLPWQRCSIRGRLSDIRRFAHGRSLVLSDTPRPFEDFRSKRVSLGVDLGKLRGTVLRDSGYRVVGFRGGTYRSGLLGTIGEMTWPRPLAPIEKHTAGGIELCKKIEINNVASQNCAPVLTGSCK